MLATLPPRKSYTIPSTSHIYSYIHIAPTTQSKTLVFLHGFPSHAPDFIHQITHFSHLGYGILVPDLLGYGQTSAPTDVTAYTLKNMSHELALLIKHALAGDSDRVVGIGHDFGATLLSRAAAFHPALFAALVFLAVGPPKLGTPFDVHAINRMTKEQVGVEMLGYVPWLGDISTADAQHACEANAASVMSVMFAAREEEVWAKHFRPLGGLKGTVTKGEKVDIAEWYPEELRRAHLDAFGRTDRGYVGVTRWYAMWMGQLCAPDEEVMGDVKLEVPTLFVGEKGIGGDMQKGFLAEWAPDLNVKLVETGHWVHLERHEVVNAEVEALLSGL